MLKLNICFLCHKNKNIVTAYILEGQARWWMATGGGEGGERDKASDPPPPELQVKNTIAGQLAIVRIVKKRGGTGTEKHHNV